MSRFQLLKQPHVAPLAVVQNVAPVPEKNTVTVQDAVARRMLKLRAKLGITADDLLSASVALESERNGDEPSPPYSKHQSGARGDQAASKAKAGGSGDARVGGGDGGGHGRFAVASGMAPDIGRWKKEADDMLSLLGTNAHKCTHEYPMTELRRKVTTNAAIGNALAAE